MTKARHARLIIVGSGPAGCTAALYAARANLQPLLISGCQPGGQLTTTSSVENWPGDASVEGPALMNRLLDHAEHFGAEIVFDELRAVRLLGSPKTLTGDAGTYSCDALIIATGAAPVRLGLPSEISYSGKGVFTCATCDGYAYKGKTVAVVGGGNAAVEEALYLSGMAKQVTVVHRRARFRAEAVLVDRLRAREEEGRVRVVWNSVIEEILGDGSRISGLRLRDTLNGQGATLGTDALFVAIGHSPNTAIFEGQLEMQDGYIATRVAHDGGATSTSAQGVFAAGDVQDRVYRQAVTSAATGCMAAFDARRYLESPR